MFGKTNERKEKSIRVWFEALFGRWSILRHLGFYHLFHFLPSFPCFHNFCHFPTILAISHHFALFLGILVIFLLLPAGAKDDLSQVKILNIDEKSSGQNVHQDETSEEKPKRELIL